MGPVEGQNCATVSHRAPLRLAFRRVEVKSTCEDTASDPRVDNVLGRPTLARLCDPPPSAMLAQLKKEAHPLAFFSPSAPALPPARVQQFRHDMRDGDLVGLRPGHLHESDNISLHESGNFAGSKQSTRPPIQKPIGELAASSDSHGLGRARPAHRCRDN